jgi:outer membrane protein TolC
MTTREILSLVLIAVYVTGCSVHRPQPTDSTVSIPLSFSEETGTPSSEEMHGRWWEAFHDPKLNALMSETLQNNPDIRMAYARLEQVQAIARATSAAQYPFLGAGGEGTREKTPSFLGDYTGDSYRLSLSAGYELDVWKKYASLTNAAELETDASLEDIKALYMSLSAQLAELYYLAVEQRPCAASLSGGTVAGTRPVPGAADPCKGSFRPTGI